MSGGEASRGGFGSSPYVPAGRSTTGASSSTSPTMIELIPQAYFAVIVPCMLACTWQTK
jgi:hypothetical protein